MFDWLRRWIIQQFWSEIVSLVCAEVQPWGHCGLCGKPINDELFPSYWAWGICQKCRKKYGGKN